MPEAPSGLSSEPWVHCLGQTAARQQTIESLGELDVGRLEMKHAVRSNMDCATQDGGFFFRRLAQVFI